MPKVPEVPKAIQFKGSPRLDRSIGFSKRVPPNYDPHRFEKDHAPKKASSVNLGLPEKGKISAYLRGGYIETKTAISFLEKSGFSILGQFSPDNITEITTIVFTNPELLSLAGKSSRGFASSLRLSIDSKNKTISIDNPLYVLKGFLQEDFNEASAKKILVSLLGAFDELKNSNDSLKYQLLSKYHFMMGMPYYEDMIDVAIGNNLLSKIPKTAIVFSQDLGEGRFLVGVSLSKKSTFVSAIGVKNAGLLPYPILIENGKARILDPKFYISFFYPKLSMSEFMNIKDIPDNIVNDCRKLFR